MKPRSLQADKVCIRQSGGADKAAHILLMADISKSEPKSWPISVPLWVPDGHHKSVALGDLNNLAEFAYRHRIRHNRIALTASTYWPALEEEYEVRAGIHLTSPQC